MSERMRLIGRLLSGERVTDLCTEFGISRKTVYKFKERYERLGPAGLYDQRRAPERSPHRVSVEVRELILEVRRERPTWGAKKLRDLLGQRHPGIKLPATSTMSELLDRAGLVTRRRRRPKTELPWMPSLDGAEPNDVWCTDYKGQFRLGTGRYCFPLTVTDHASRFIFACEGFDRIDGESARLVFDDLFSRYGMPKAIRSDNGTPFASTGFMGLSRLSVYWLRLGIQLDRIDPGHPEQNGRHERMHRTLKADTTRPAAATLLQQQERFDLFVERFNHERPHEGIEERKPAQVYRPSTTTKPEGPLQYPLHDDVRIVTRNGRVLTRRRSPGVFISEVFSGERVGLRELHNGDWLVSFASLELGHIDSKRDLFIPWTPKEKPIAA